PEQGVSLPTGKRLSLEFPELIFALMAAFASGRTLAATNYFVNGASGSGCSDGGPGSSSVPYCTISAAIATHSGAGITINVNPATYRETVTVNTSGTSGNPFILKASGSTPVIVDGSDDFTGTGKWSLVSGSLYRASTVTWDPVQVF